MTRKLEHACDVLSFSALLMMMAVVVFDVVLRYFFNMPLETSIELVEIGIVGTIFLALPGASGKGAHISIDYIDGMMSERARAVLDRLSHVLIAAVLFALSGGLALRGIELVGRGDVSIALHYPTGLVAFAMAIAIAVTATVHLRQVFTTGLS